MSTEPRITVDKAEPTERIEKVEKSMSSSPSAHRASELEKRGLEVRDRERSSSPAVRPRSFGHYCI